MCVSGLATSQYAINGLSKVIYW